MSTWPKKLGTRAFCAAQRVLFGQTRKVRFKGKNQMDTVEGKSNRAGIRWRNGCVVWRGLTLPAIIDPEDPVIRHALSCRVKYVRLVRRKISGRNRFYAQLICEGTPYRKPKNALGEGIVGIDAGPSIIARVNSKEAVLSPLLRGACREGSGDTQAPAQAGSLPQSQQP